MWRRCSTGFTAIYRKETAHSCSGALKLLDSPSSSSCPPAFAALATNAPLHTCRARCAPSCGGAAMDSRGGGDTPYPPQLTLDRRPIIDGCATVAHAPRVGRRAPDGRHGLLRRQDERRRAHLGRNDGVSTAEGARHSPRNRFARRRPLRARCVVTPTASGLDDDVDAIPRRRRHPHFDLPRDQGLGWR